MSATSSHDSTLVAYLQMMRPANILTAWADILLGYAASGAASSLFTLTAATSVATSASLGWLLLATTGLYGGGVVFNDVFDADLDAEERPERPIPSGRATKQEAIALGSILLLVGVMAAAQVSLLSALLSVFIAVTALSYDAIAKHHSLLGPLNMGLCRGANLLLGVSAMPLAVESYWFLALIPVLYIAGITTISRGEVHGGNRSTGIVALLLLGLVIASIAGLTLLPTYGGLGSLPFALLFVVLVLPKFVQATIAPTAEQIRAAVKAGIICLIILDAAIASGFTNWIYGLCVLSLLPISRGLAKLFAVT
ncbi:prenyltransferase, UbiA family [Synechococcus sp. PCC 7335]|uniref:UbiA-like protein EboC n=1 Tax=Synechococcus sp. (strain ATCC 29403 / PCC 7335) TaxID=91464 RepID=UPI00017ECE03|nr:UbiA-like protein EboC [Synechococcus sp. PCC 7335]EDX84940.1 prenyltransferase, UbiA family [Synechococcus sp. PCC 7335]